MKRLVAIAIVAGLLIPIGWMTLYHQFESFAQWWFTAPQWVEAVRLVFWPSALLLIADPHDDVVSLWAVSALVNAAWYGALAGLVGRAVQRLRS